MGKSIKSGKARVSKDSIFYYKSDMKSLPISNVSSVEVSPKVNVLSIFGAALLGGAAYQISTTENADSIGEGLGKHYQGIALFVLGISSLIFGLNKNRVYYLD